MSDPQVRTTPRQREVLAFIADRLEAESYPPTVREIGENLGIRWTNAVADHLKALKKKGLLEQQGHKSRTLRLTHQGYQVLGRNGPELTSAELAPQHHQASIAIPVLGRVAAGEPILAIENAEESVVVDRMLVGGRQDVYALRIVGDSMIEDGIFDGDYIFVQKRSTAERGAIVVAMIDGEATVKRYYPEPDRIRFQPANARLSPIYVHRNDFKQTQILGGVVGVYRQLSS